MLDPMEAAVANGVLLNVYRLFSLPIDDPARPKDIGIYDYAWKAFQEGKAAAGLPAPFQNDEIWKLVNDHVYAFNGNPTVRDLIRPTDTREPSSWESGRPAPPPAGWTVAELELRSNQQQILAQLGL